MKISLPFSVLADLRFLAMGTQISITVMGHDHDAWRARTAVERVRAELVEFGHDFWAWGTGRLAALNRELADGKPIAIPLDMRELFSLAWGYRQTSGGLFEPRIGELVRLWGFDDIRKLGTAPADPVEIGRLLRALADAPAYDGGPAYGPAPDIAWDFGGIGKGYIVDRSLNRLFDQGFPNVLIDAGGNLAARGRRGERAWRIGIRDPRSLPDKSQLLAALDIGDEAVVTHGDDQRYFEYAGKRYAHVLDPGTGRPMQGMRSLTLVHADATRADAEGAALYAAGPNRWRSMARRLGLDQVMVVLDNGKVQITEHLARRIAPREDVELEIV